MRDSVSITVEPVTSRRDLKRFVELPYGLHVGTPWVPPIRSERRRFLDRSKNPFFEHAEAEYFLACRDGRVVGRITAQLDSRWDQFQGGSDGWFGFFETEDDTEVAAALLGTAADWVAARGRKRLLGPADFTTNDEIGLLVEGFELAPMILEPWHPPFYRDLIEAQGLTKAMDLLMWKLWLGELTQGEAFHEMIEQAAAKCEAEGVRVRTMRKADLVNEIGRFLEVYNAAWGENWGFVPVTEAEVAFQAQNLNPVLSEDWAMIAERDGEVLGAGLTLPDVNQILAKMNGSLLPFGWLRFLRGMRNPQGVAGVPGSNVDAVRVFALGVKPAYQHLGVAALLFVRHRETAARMPQKGGETGWILETNEPMNRAMEGMGGEVVKRYRIYEKAL
ncbi:MAG: GNAT family N-acetyltransferase [Solirubrobacterales bacterium]